MIERESKCVIVVDGALPSGILANTAAILGVTLGRRVPGLVGPDVTDASGMVHPGIIMIPVPVLRGTRESLRELRLKLYDDACADLVAVDFSDVAQSCRVYDEYTARAARVPEAAHVYYGIGICGPKKKVGRLTGSLPLLR